MPHLVEDDALVQVVLLLQDRDWVLELVIMDLLDLLLVFQLAKQVLSLIEEGIAFSDLSKVQVPEDDFQVDVEFLLVLLGEMELVLHQVLTVTVGHNGVLPERLDQ